MLISCGSTTEFGLPNSLITRIGAQSKSEKYSTPRRRCCLSTRRDRIPYRPCFTPYFMRHCDMCTFCPVPQQCRAYVSGRKSMTPGRSENCASLRSPRRRREASQKLGSHLGVIEVLHTRPFPTHERVSKGHFAIIPAEARSCQTLYNPQRRETGMLQSWENSPCVSTTGAPICALGLGWYSFNRLGFWVA